MPSEGSITVGKPGDGPSRMPAAMKIGIAERRSRPARTLATTNVTRTTARSLSSSRGALWGVAVGAAGGDYRDVRRALPTISRDVAHALAVHPGQEARRDRPRRPGPAVDQAV